MRRMMGDAAKGGGGIAMIGEIVGDVDDPEVGVGECGRGTVEVSASRGVCVGRKIGLAKGGTGKCRRVG